MNFFLDSASLEEIRTANSWGVIAGVTTNPSLVAKEGGDFKKLLREIVKLVDGPVSAEVLSMDVDGMLREAAELASIATNVVIKVPMTLTGLQVVKQLAKQGIKTNVTLIFSANQALLAARAGGTFVSPFVGRLDDISHDGIQVVRDCAEIFGFHNIDTKIIAASIRHPLHVTESAKAGADYATVPFKVLEQIAKHPLTDIGVERFLSDWKKAGLTKIV